ncbi:hypothetical protein Cmaq_0301 [Caldivirga maquilingensis IC-167]|uniref:Uncharacterized protein n=1 Tax=Caldivirga maquilingensis (strain ATCC 700844 / DSM 13496 / JCM 10307 / IC-167) TaxID=397948 RepID=A8MB59_CALMQ|nr:hypothetical protein Cmaq_0301 [Caldivirga maquilingensis IC-167]
MRIRGINSLLINLPLLGGKSWLIAALLIIMLPYVTHVVEADASLSVTYTVNYINYYTSSGVKSYINYGVNLINENSTALNVIVGFRLPPYSSILYASSGYVLKGDEIYWNITINSFETMSLNVEFQNPLVNNYIMNFKYLINDSTTPSQVINGSSGVKLIMLVNASNALGLPLTYNAYIPLQNGINYYYSTPPTGVAGIGTGNYMYWSGELPNNGSVDLNVTFIVANSGNWSAIDLGSLIFTSSIDLYYYLNYLKLTIGQLNNTLTEFNNIPYVRPISSNATILLNDLYQLSYLLNTTAALYRQSAYYMNSTRVIESLLLLQVYEVDYALRAEYGVLSKLNSTIPMVSYSLKQIMSNLTQLNNEIINLQYQVISDVVYAYGEIEQYNVTLMEIIPILNATNTTLAEYYQYLGYVQDNLTKLYNDVNSLNINGGVKSSILGELSRLIKDVEVMRATVLRLEGYVNGAEMGVLTASRQLSELAYQLNTRGTALVIALTNISNTLVKTNQSVYSLYIALNYLSNTLNSTTSTLNVTLGRLNLALAVPTSLYGNLTNITSGLIQTSSQLQNASARLMSMYFNLTGQYLLFSLAINQSIEYQRANLVNELNTYEAYYGIAKGTYDQYLSSLIINSSSPYVVDIVVEQTSEVNLPIVLNMRYISSVLSNITIINTDNGKGGSMRGISKGTYGLLIIVLALTLGLILNKRKYVINNIINHP